MRIGDDALKCIDCLTDVYPGTRFCAVHLAYRRIYKRATRRRSGLPGEPWAPGKRGRPPTEAAAWYQEKRLREEGGESAG